MARSDLRTAGLFLLPSLGGFLLFYLIPFAGAIAYSLVDTPVGGRFVGLANYGALLANPPFLRAVANTVLFSALCLPLIIAISLGIAMLLNRTSRGSSVLRMGLIVPLVLPVASVALVWQIIFDANGPLNALLASLGMARPPDWMNGPGARWVILVVYLWKNIGYDMVLFLAGLQGIPPEYYEAARLDGAGPWRTFTNITAVYLAPTSFFVLVISIINSFKVFRETYLMAGPYPERGIYFLQHYLNNTFHALDYQKLTAAAVVLCLGIYALVLALFSVERRIRRALG